MTSTLLTTTFVVRRSTAVTARSAFFVYGSRRFLSCAVPSCATAASSAEDRPPLVVPPGTRSAVPATKSSPGAAGARAGAAAPSASKPVMAISPGARAAVLSLKPLRRRKLGFGFLNNNNNSSNGYRIPSNMAAFGAQNYQQIGSGAPTRKSLVLGGVAAARPPPRPKSLVNGAVPQQKKNLISGGGFSSSSPRKSLVNGYKQLVDNNSINHAANGSSSLRVNGCNGQHRDSYYSSSDNHDDDDDDSSSKSDLIVVLDMDECLVHSQFLSSPEGPDMYRQYEAERPHRSQAFTHDEEAESIVSSSCESFRISLPDGDLVHVNKRPNLDRFLQEITSRYETHVFTAAMEIYAKPVLDVLDPRGTIFAKRFYREHCYLHDDLGVYVKDLNRILNTSAAAAAASNPHGSVNGTNDNNNKKNGWFQRFRMTRQQRVSSGELDSIVEEEEDEYFDEDETMEEEERVSIITPNGASGLLTSLPFNEKRVVLVDNNPLSFLANPSNGILVSNFYDDPKDDTLEAVMELLYELEEVEDVRPVLDAKFGLKEALREVVRSGTWR